MDSDWPGRGSEGDGRPWGHAIVIGAGIAGLLIARVLADFFQRVTVLERDRDSDREVRSGTPQAWHLHVMLARGSSILEELFPGLRAELTDVGAPRYDHGEMRLMLPTGWAPWGSLGIPLQSCTRPTLEAHIRRRVTRLPGVQLRTGIGVTGLRLDSTGRRVVGVVTDNVNDRTEHTELSAEADLVVDASGRTSRLPDWLVDSGFPRPQAHVVDVGLTYASRLYAAPPDEPLDVVMTAQLPYAPHLPARGVAMSLVEGGRWMVSMFGLSGDHPPNTDEGFLDFVAGLSNQDIAAAIRRAEPLTPIHRYVRITSRLLDYHRMAHYPQCLLAVGESVCSFNPIYGQGMTVAGIEALRLREMLRSHPDSTDLTWLAPRFLRQLARDVRLPWLMGTTADLGWADGPLPTQIRLGQKYFSRLLETIPTNPGVYKTFAQTWHMLRGPAPLASPTVLARMAATTLTRRR